MRRILFSFIPCVLFSAILNAQVAQWPPAPPFSNQMRPTIRDPHAASVVQAALTAMGGSTVIGQAQSWQVQGQMRGTQNANRNGAINWEMAGSEFRMGSTINGTTTYMLTGHGKPSSVASGAATPLPSHVVRALFIPALVAPVLLREFQDQNYSLESGGTTMLGSEPVEVVRTSCRTGQMEALVTPQTWYFDAATSLPARIEFRMPAAAGPRLYISAAADFSDYRNIAGSLYPFHITSSRLGKQTNVITVQSLNPNAAIPASEFDAPTGGVR